MPKGGGGSYSAASKWVVKGAKEEEEEKLEKTPKKAPPAKDEKPPAPKREPRPKKEPKSKKKDPVEEEPLDPQYDTSAEGKVYNLHELLKIKVAAAKAAAEGSTLEGGRLAMQERPDEDASKVTGARREIVKQQKEKKAQRKGSGLDLDDETMADGAGEAAEAADIVQTPSQRIALEKELPAAGSYTPMAAPWDYTAFLQAMYAPSTPMAGPAGGYTTVMLRNIPNKYTRESLIEQLNKSGYQGQFDFIYLPIDFNSKCNVGYGFINFKNSSVCARFHSEFHNKQTKTVLPGYSSNKTCEVVYARLQGRDANMENMKVGQFIDKLHKRPDGQPKFWDDAGKEMTFDEVFGTEGSGVRKSKIEKAPVVPPQTPTYDPMAMMYGGGWPFPASPMGMFSPFWPGAPGTPAPAAATQKAPQEPRLTELLPDSTPQSMQMLRNIPNSVTRKDLMELVDKTLKGEYNFLYIPDNAVEGGNRGFAFVNFKDVKKATVFVEQFNDKHPNEIFGVGEPDAQNCKVVNAKLGSIDKTIDKLRMDIANDASDKNKKGKKKKAEAKSEEEGEAKSEGAEASKEEEEKTPEPTKDRSPWYPIMINSKGEVEDYPVEKADSKADAALQNQGKKKAKKGEGDEGKAAGKGEKKGRRVSDPYQQMVNPLSPWHPYLAAGGYPYAGYPGYGNVPRVPSSYANQMYEAALRNHAAQTAAAQTGRTLDALSLGANKKKSKGHHFKALREQVEFYFSKDNLCKDEFLRKQMNGNGWVELKTVANFKKMKNLGASEPDVCEALTKSGSVEVSEDKNFLRVKEEGLRTQFPRMEAGAQPKVAA